MGTLGKSLGSFGAFVAGSAALRELLVNTARSFIFSCALAPPQVEAARAALRLVEREPWRRERLQANSARLRARARDRAAISTAPSTTHIVPVVIGDNATTMAVCESLLERGFYAQGIRYPSVPEGTARLRITPMATHRRDARSTAFADALRRGSSRRQRAERRLAEHARRSSSPGTDTGVGKTVVALRARARRCAARASTSAS